MHCPSSRQVKMNKENATAAKHEEPTTRITRARAKASGTSVGLFPASKPSFKQDQKHPLREKTKRAASDENKSCSTSVAGLKHKRRAVLKDVTNVLCENSHLNCNIATKQHVCNFLACIPIFKICNYSINYFILTFVLGIYFYLHLPVVIH